ncbi:hypothetical protein EOA32_00855 [Mesorhizobium sp. M1A.F.Ca.ET.072.01.1.1]|uniref:DUF6651 domain-containing protein n=1 Tax=Mesorhizobium sp. M1A.F.Ca.ET.072.01.1.1 TaxID=2496753 RepID=UPI000FD4ACD1|nr:DUF6651 domain-containing protein [Mesorhizobium sp. M1A.F.Ca.ET.072.01.1.1]RUW55601.1 hypothetical protein EOA32_00855 [Mesorhizobium sp. M1A.F.Ca.ET.072.01.1.1]
MIAAAATFANLYPIAFDTGKAGWKLDKDGKIEMRDGNPIYLDSSGNETAIEGGTISRLNAEAKNHREAKERAEADLNKFKDAAGKLIDPTTALKAIETVGKLDAKKLIDSGEVDKLKEQIKGELTAQLTEKDNKIKEQAGVIDTMTLNAAFSSSKFIQDRIAVPADMFRSTFSKHFKVEDGKVVPYGADGNKILSSNPNNFGNPADLDEALEKIVDTYAGKDAILKAPNASGSGNGGGGGGRGNGRFIKRADFEKLSPAEQSSTSQQAAKGEISIVD